MTEFTAFPKIARLNRPMIITEKIDGTNAQIYIEDDGVTMHTGSRTRWITPEQDNYGFARWASEHKDELKKLGPGHHFGEWWGSGIQRSYGLTKGDKRFSLFNISRWSDSAIRPACCSVVPLLYEGLFNTPMINCMLEDLRTGGSQAVRGFMQPEGIVVYHVQGNLSFKITLEKDDEYKGKSPS